MNRLYVSKCLNGDLRVGDEVMNTPMDDYPIMRGRVVEIQPAGSEAALNETSNNGDCVHIEFVTEGLSEKRRAELEVLFSNIYGVENTLADICLDDVIEAQDTLLNINSISDHQRSMIDDSEESAIATAFEILSEYSTRAAASNTHVSMLVNNGGQQVLSQQSDDGGIAFTRLFPDNKRIV